MKIRHDRDFAGSTILLIARLRHNGSYLNGTELCDDW